MEEENSFDVKYKEVIDFIKKIKSIKQEKEGNKMIKELEKEIDITYTSKEQNEMKREIADLRKQIKAQNNNIKNLNFRKLFSNERTLDASPFVEGLSCGFDLDYKFFFHSFAKPAKRYFCFG